MTDPFTLQALPLLPAGAAALAVVSLVVLAFRRGRRAGASQRAQAHRASPSAGPESFPTHQVAVLREELGAVKSRSEQNERLLLMLPECTKQLVNVWLPESNIPNVAIRQVKSLLDPDMVVLFLLDAEGDTLTLSGAFGLPPALRAGNADGPGLRIPIGEGLVGLAAELGSLVDEPTYRFERPRAAPGRGERPGLRVDLAAPILLKEELLGVLAIRGSRQPADYQRWLLTLMAELTAVAIGTARSRQEIGLEATTDALTGLFNRKYLAERLAAELKRAEAYGAPVSVLMFDVDNFKHYNDHNGHPAGDACLKAIARTVRQITRGTDFVARYGGEEFVVVAVGSDRTQALGHAERIRAAVEAIDIEGAAAQPLGCVSASVGVATFPMHGRTMEELIEAADAALYRSKQAGRNRVTEAASGYLSDPDASLDPATIPAERA
jgi:diguanylate cyclase (GGDEF)-like protein